MAALVQPSTRAVIDALRGQGLTRDLFLTDTSAGPILDSGLAVEGRSSAK